MRTPSLLSTCGFLVAAAACGGSTPAAPAEAMPPFKPVASIKQLMEGPIGHASAVYWGSVSTIVDKGGIHENFPQTDEQWEAVWASAITLAESGNLLMMPSRTRADPDWDKFSADLVAVGNRAAQAAEARNPELVLEQGEQVYNACTACHLKFIVDAEQPETKLP